MSKPLLEIKDLKKYYPIKRGIFYKTVGYIKAVEDPDIARLFVGNRIRVGGHARRVFLAHKMATRGRRHARRGKRPL